MTIIFILLTLNKNIIDNYLDKWLKKDDSVLVFNYKKNSIIYSYNKKNFKKNIPVGSIFKIVSLYALLDKNILNHKHRCSYKEILLHKQTKCWYKAGHGYLDLEKAFVNSCNQYFYSLYDKLTIDEWMNYANKLGFRNYHLDNKTFIPYVFAGNSINFKSNIYELAGVISIFASEGNFLDLENKSIKFNLDDKEMIKKINKFLKAVIIHGTGNKIKYFKNKFYGKTGTYHDKNNRYNGVFIGFVKEKNLAFVVNIYDNIGSNAAKMASEVLYLIDR